MFRTGILTLAIVFGVFVFLLGVKLLLEMELVRIPMLDDTLDRVSGAQACVHLSKQRAIEIARSALDTDALSAITQDTGALSPDIRSAHVVYYQDLGPGYDPGGRDPRSWKYFVAFQMRNKKYFEYAIGADCDARLQFGGPPFTIG